MSVPVWTSGQVVTASDVNTWFVPLSVSKAADTARASTTTLANDPDLSVPLLTSAAYRIEGLLIYKGGTAGSSDLKMTFTVPTGTTGMYFSVRQNVSGALAGAFPSNWTDTLTANTSGTSNVMNVAIFGILQTTSTAGNLVLQWAQNTSNATATTVMALSHLIAQRIG